MDLSKILGVLKLDKLQGSRTQITIVIGLVINALVQFGVLHLTPEQIDTTNKFLVIVAGFFFAEKVSNQSK